MFLVIVISDVGACWIIRPADKLGVRCAELRLAQGACGPDPLAMMGQQTPMANNVPTGGGVGVTPPPPPPSSTINGGAPPPPPPPQGQQVMTGTYPTWFDFFTERIIYFQGPVKKARSGYNAKAMAEIRNSLRPFEESSGQPNGVQLLGAGSSRPLSSLSYNECIQTLVNLGFDEVGYRTHTTFLCVEHTTST